MKFTKQSFEKLGNLRFQSKIILISVILMIVLVGCKQSEELGEFERQREEIIGPESVSEYEERAPSVPEEGEGGEAVIIEAAPVLGERLAAIVDKSDRVDSMEYSYATSLYNSHFYVMGDKIKQVFTTKQKSTEYVSYDTVYSDASAKTIIAYCEGDECHDDELDIAVAVDYDDFVTETPLDVVNSMTYGSVKETQMLENKECAIVERELDDGTLERMWVWTYAGIPLKREFYDDDDVRINRISYLGLNINDLTESDVTRS